MNSTKVSKISLPSEAVLNFYNYFTYFTLFLTGIITPILFYTILTQSKNLNHGFKWFVLNHSFWSIMFEILLGLFKPVWLTPAYACFPLGIARVNGSFERTSIILIFFFVFCINYNAAFGATIANRYLTTFHLSWTKWITKKLIIIMAIVVSLFMDVITVIAILLILFNGSDTIIQSAKNYDIFFEIFNEPSMLFLPSEYVYWNNLVAYAITIGLNIGGIGVLIFFYYSVQTNKYSASMAKMQKSLIISSIFQILISIIFFGFPILLLFTFFLFEIEHSSEWLCLAFAILSMHSLLESIATLYFVLPYRKFIKKTFLNFTFFRTSIVSTTTNINVVTNIIFVINRAQ